MLTDALEILRNRHADLSDEEARDRLRLGTVFFAAADVPASRFVEALPAIHTLADASIVSATADDAALSKGRLVMGGDVRIGESRRKALTDEQRAWIASLERFQYVDVSAESVEGGERRGFDITGHRYWFDHPWASSDMLLSIRSDLPPSERQLERVGPNRWAIPSDYPERLRRAIEAGGGGLRRPTEDAPR